MNSPSNSQCRVHDGGQTNPLTPAHSPHYAALDGRNWVVIERGLQERH